MHLLMLLQANLNAEGTIPTEIFEKGTARTVEEAVEAAKCILERKKAAEEGRAYASLTR